MNKKKFIMFVLFTFLVVAAADAKPKQTQTFQQYTPTYAQPAATGAYTGAYPNYGYEQSDNVAVTSQPQYYAQPQATNTTNTTLHGRVVMIPANVSIPTVTTAEYSTETMTIGQNFDLVLANAFSYDGLEVAPAGSTIRGTVIQSKAAGHATKNAMLEVRFTSIVTPYGQTIPISGKIKTDDGSGIIYGGTTKDSAKEYTKDLAVGAGGGALAGTVLGALSGGSVGMGAVYGTAVGAGVGLAKSLWSKGGDVVIPANACVDVVLEQPATYTPVQYR